MSNTVLELQGLTKCFGGLTAVDHVDMQIKKGELHGLIGPNGSGKTTIINLITGMYKPTEGKILFNGEDIAGLQPYEITRHGISRTFQNLRLFKKMSVLENVLVGRHLSINDTILNILVRKNEKSEKIQREEAMKWIEFVGLKDKADYRASDLPYGDQRLVEIARALAANPSLILLDEPLAGMNREESDKVVAFFQKILDLGISMILVEHSVRIVMSVSDNITVLNFGKKIAAGTADEVQKNPLVIEAYLGTRREKHA